MIPDGRWMNQSRHTINAVRISEQESLARVELEAREDMLVQPARFLLAELRDDLVEIIRLHINGASTMGKSTLASRASTFPALAHEGSAKLLRKIGREDSCQFHGRILQEEHTTLGFILRWFGIAARSLLALFDLRVISAGGRLSRCRLGSSRGGLRRGRRFGVALLGCLVGYRERSLQVLRDCRDRSVCGLRHAERITETLECLDDILQLGDIEIGQWTVLVHHVAVSEINSE